jgi:aminoglycoside 3-N-acetyltransferase
VVALVDRLFDSVTLLHHAEYRAAVPNKRHVEYEMPVLVDGQRVWRRTRELDSSDGAFPYETLGLDEDAFAIISRGALGEGIGRSGPVGAASAHLLPAAPLLSFACRWLESAFAHHG